MHPKEQWHAIAGADGMDCGGHYLGGALQVWKVGGAGE